MWQYSRPTHFIVIYFDVKLSLAHRGSKIFISFFGGLKWEVLSFFLLFEQFSPQLISNAKMEQEDAGDKNLC